MAICAASRYLSLIKSRPLLSHIVLSPHPLQHNSIRTLSSNQKIKIRRQKYQVNERFKQSLETQASDESEPAVKLAEEDTFGNYPLDPSEKIVTDFEFQEEDNDAQDRHEAIIGDILRPGKQDFLNKLNHLIHEKRDLRSALEEMQVKMKEELVQPQVPHFRVLIHACAKAGYTKKAFELYKEYRARGFKPHIGIYTDLFLSCSNSPNKAYALKSASLLRKKMKDDHWLPNKITYQSMITAFGRCGDLEESFHILDEMRKNRVEVDVETFAHLLNGCLFDKEHGFRHALLTWRMMRRKRVNPDLICYNLMLGVAIDCGLGDKRFFDDVLINCLAEENRHKLKNPAIGEQKGLIGDGSVKEDKRWERDIEGSELKIVESREKAGLVKTKDNNSLLEKRPRLENVVGITMLDNQENRLLLMGGAKGFIQQMLWEIVTPDIRTISQLLRLAPNTLQVENEILDMIPQLQIKTDIGFYNQLIKQRAFRMDYTLGINTLAQIQEDGLEPDIITFGCLAMCCRTRKDSLQLVKDIRNLGSRLNNVILSTLIGNARVRHSPRDVLLFMKIGEQEELVPNDNILDNIEKFYQTYRALILKKEKGGFVPYEVVKEMRNDQKDWREFCKFYKEWLARQNIDYPEHPWEQFRISKDKDTPFP